MMSSIWLPSTLSARGASEGRCIAGEPQERAGNRDTIGPTVANDRGSHAVAEFLNCRKLQQAAQFMDSDNEERECGDCTERHSKPTEHLTVCKKILTEPRRSKTH